METTASQLFERLAVRPKREQPTGYERRYAQGIEQAARRALGEAASESALTVLPSYRFVGFEFDAAVASNGDRLLFLDVKTAPRRGDRAAAWLATMTRSFRSRSARLSDNEPGAWYSVLVFAESEDLERVDARLERYVPSVVDSLFVVSIARDVGLGLVGDPVEPTARRVQANLTGVFGRLVESAANAERRPPPRRRFHELESESVPRQVEDDRRGERMLPPSPDSAHIAAEVAIAPLSALLVASEWDSRHGGLSTFNRDLAGALAGKGVEVICYVPDATEAEIRDARDNFGVKIAVATENVGLTPLERLLQRPPVRAGFNPSFIVGHGRLLGAHARTLQQQFFEKSCRVHIVHTHSEALEWAKPLDQETSRTAEERKVVERDLVRTADIVCAVGPRLRSYAETLLRAAAHEQLRVIELLPGLPDVATIRELPSERQCLIVGRAEDVEVKGLDIAAEALKLYVAHPRRLGSVPTLAIRGAPSEEVQDLHANLRGLAGDEVPIVVRTYEANRSTIVEDLFEASVVLMPSRQEGFGLAALEAIAANVPVLISDKSGLADVIDVYPSPDVDPQWSVVGITRNIERDAAVWCEAIQDVLEHPRESFARATALRTLMDGTGTWADVADGIIGAVGSSVGSSAERPMAARHGA